MYLRNFASIVQICTQTHRDVYSCSDVGPPVGTVQQRSAATVWVGRKRNASAAPFSYKTHEEDLSSGETSCFFYPDQVRLHSLLGRTVIIKTVWSEWVSSVKTVAVQFC